MGLYVNIFNIPQLIREISCDVKHIRKCYDDSQKVIEDYKIELVKEREDSSKWIIINKREEYKIFLRQSN